MLSRLRRSSLRFKASCLGAGCVLLACGLTVLLLPVPGETVDHPEAANLRAVVGASATSAAVFALLFGWLMRPINRLQRDLGKLTAGGEAQLATDTSADREVRRLRSGFRTLAQQIVQLRADDDAARLALEARTSTVNRILEFSQIVQGVGRVEQVYATLTHYLRTELQLIAVAIIETDDTGSARLSARWPDELVPQAGSFDCASCPCFRQSLPRCFNDGSCPVRCGVEQWLDIPSSLPALCVPISSSGERRAVIHMVRPIDLPWDDASRQLTQTFVHSASAAIVMLDLLEDARRAGMTDALTGLYNRRSMDQLLQREVALARRHLTPLSLVLIDLDDFKGVNDRHGHAAGDFVLRQFGKCVQSTLRRTDMAFRYGGDEFVIVLPQTTLHQAHQVIGKLRQAFAQIDVADAITHMAQLPKLSAGVAHLDVESGVGTADELLAAADQGMYEQKAEHRRARPARPTADHAA